MRSLPEESIKQRRKQRQRDFAFYSINIAIITAGVSSGMIELLQKFGVI